MQSDVGQSAAPRRLVFGIISFMLIFAALVALSNNESSGTSEIAPTEALSAVAPTQALSAVTFCWRKRQSYGRGRGRLKRSCEAKYGAGKCEGRTALWYQKCRSEYSPFGCCICRKKAEPVPAGWVKCGLGAANNQATCKQRIRNQVVSVFESIAQVAGLIASAGTSAAADEAANAAERAGEVLDAFSDPASGLASIAGGDTKEAYDLAQKAKDYAKSLQDAAQAGNKAQAARAALDAASVFDPTGLAKVASAFTYPRCST